MQARVLSGRYELVERLGRGGMSVVWRARDLVLERDVAVKMLAATTGLATVNMRAEAMAAAKVVHPHVASVFDFGEIELENEGPTAFIVMELLEGTRLSDTTMPMPPRRALRIGAEVGAALAAAHAKGVVHRDVKPGNIMLTDAGAKMYDFGIAASVGTPDLDTGAVILGSPRYVAPERLLGEPVTAASDVYSLGVVLFCLLTGGFPWPAGTVDEMVTSHVAAEPTDMPDIAGVPDEVRAIYRRAVARDPEDRPDAAEIATVLADAAGISVRLGDEAPGHDRPASGRPVRRSTVALVGLAIVVSGGAAVAAWMVPRAPAPLAAAPIDSTAIATTTASTATPAGPDPAPSTATAPTPSGKATPKPVSRPVQAKPGNQPPPVGATTNPAPPPSETQSPPSTFSTADWQVVAICRNDQAVLLSWTPIHPYNVDTVVQGPAPEASVVFRHGPLASTVTVTCVAGVPVATESDS